MNLKDYVANVPNFPKEGIQFKDITPLMADGQAYDTCRVFADKYRIIAPSRFGYLYSDIKGEGRPKE